MAAPYGEGLFTFEPPSGNGLNITDTFHIIKAKPDDPGIFSRVDSQYPNVAIITFDTTNQFGGMWAKEKLDLTMPFSTEMHLHLGHSYGNTSSKVADGMTFTMHNDPDGIDAIGGAGEGLGVCRGRKWTGVDQNTVRHGTFLQNSLVIEFDTYRNLANSGSYVVDPPGTAHCAVLMPRANTINESDHRNTFTFTPSQRWIPFKVSWMPNQTGGGKLSYTFDTTTKEFTVANVLEEFKSNKVYWGFTGATGQLTSVQAVAISRLPLQGIDVKKTVKNSAGENINNGSVLPGDVITYTIKVTALTGHGQIGPIVIEDIISQYLQYTPGNVKVFTKDGGEHNVMSSYISNLMTLHTNLYLNGEGDWLEFSFNAIVHENTEGGEVITNEAEVSASSLPESKKSNKTEVTVYSNPEKRVGEYSEAGKNGAAVKPGDNITYEIFYAANGEALMEVVITDKLTDDLDFIYASNGGVYNKTTHTVTWTLKNVAGGTIDFVTLIVNVNDKAAVKVRNRATVKIGGNNPLNTNEVENPVISEGPKKKVSDYSTSGKDGNAVTQGDNVTYEISYQNDSEKEVKITITDRLPFGVDYVSSDNGGQYSKDDHTITWEFLNVPGGYKGVVSFVVQVNKMASGRIVNSADVQTDDGTPEHTNNVEIPVKGSRCRESGYTSECRTFIKGHKIWLDNDNISGTRPKSIEIVLYRDNKEYKTISIDSTGDGVYVFECLPIWRDSNHKYNYRVDEKDVPAGYQKTIRGYDIINRLPVYR